MTLKIAFAGFRHNHIFGLYNLARQRDDLEIVGAAEEDLDTRASLDERADLAVTHDSVDTMLEDVDCDIVAIGDYYGARGGIAVKALEAGRHVIADKPVCTSLEELDRIESLCNRTGLRLGCMLDLRDTGASILTRELVRSGQIGEVRAIQFGGQHPLLWGKRPGWYFEKGKHGGTINDIAIHAFDLIPWVTGRAFTRVTAARVWNDVAEAPDFQSGAQTMLELDNGAGVLGDVSYHMPDSQGYTLAQYWRVTFFGEKGLLESSLRTGPVTLALDGDDCPRPLEVPEPESGRYLQSFVDDINGRASDDRLSTETIIEAARKALKTQKAADENKGGIEL